MPPVLHLKPDEIDTLEKRGKFTVSLVGCGRKAVFYALAFAEAGFKVICVDKDQSVVKRLSKGNIQLGDRQTDSKLRGFIRKEKIDVTSDLKEATSNSNIIVLTVSPKIDDKKIANPSDAVNVYKQVGTALQKGSLVVFSGIAGLGFVENTIREIVENRSGLRVGEDFGLVYIPNFDSSEPKDKKVGNFKVTIASDDKFSMNAAALIFEAIAKNGVRRVSDIKGAELASLFEAAKRESDQALANELAVFCEKAGLDYVTTVDLLENSDSVKSSPPRIVEGINREVYLLLENAENLNAKLKLLSLARQVNEDMVRHALNLTQEALRRSGKSLRRANVALLGEVEAGTSAAAFVDALENKGAKVGRYNPLNSGNHQLEEGKVKKTLNEAMEGADCVVILSALEQLGRLNLKKMHAVMRSPAAFVDLAGVAEPEKVEKAGFTYRGLGRGAWKK